MLRPAAEKIELEGWPRSKSANNLRLRNEEQRRMSKLMKDARDIRLLGIGLVAGMVLGYFIASEQSVLPLTTPVPMTLAQTPPPTAPAAAPPEMGPVEWFESPFAPRTITLKH